MSGCSSISRMAPPLVIDRPSTAGGGRMFNREPPFGSKTGNPFMPPEGRRPDVAALLASLTSGASLLRDPRAARQRFEEELRSALQARSVVIREDTMLPPPPNVMCIAIPLAAGDLRVRLEAVSTHRGRLTSGRRS